MKKLYISFLVMILLCSCRTFFIDSNYSELSNTILQKAISVEIKLGWWDEGFNLKEPDYILTDLEKIKEIANIIGETGVAYDGVLECGYTGSMVFNYSDNTRSPEMLFNEDCGSFEFWIGEKQIAGYITKDNALKLTDIISHL